MIKLAIVGDVWNESDEQSRSSLSGIQGYVLNKLLDEVGIHRADCLITSAFNLRPRPVNDISSLCVNKKECGHDLPPLSIGKYIHSKYLPELDRLTAELDEANPHLTVALGNVALWALTYQTGFTSKRGTVLHHKRKILPTHHPRSIIKDYSLRAVTLFDLMKAAKEQEFPEIRRPIRHIVIEPTLSEMESYYETHLANAPYIAFDIETAQNQITCIGFAPSTSSAIVIPFVHAGKPGSSYWPDAHEEQLAWRYVARVLKNASAKLTQNGLYDVNFLWSKYGITVNNWSDDTMLLHHALHPEIKKGLGFLGSIYTNEASWKIMRNKTTKKEN